MKKILFAMVASLATLIATSAGAQATFTVSVSGIGETGISNNPATPNTVGVQYQSTLTGTGVFGGISVTAFETFPKKSQLVSSVSILNFSGATLAPITITITQDAYTFPTAPWYYSNNVSAGVTGTITSANLTISATNQATQNPSFTGTSVYSTNVPANAGGGPYSITHTYVITGLTTGSAISITADTLISSPLPATALMAGLGFPLLGLAGAARRRLFA